MIPTPRPRTLAIAAAAGLAAGAVVAVASLVGLGALTLVAPTAIIVASVVVLQAAALTRVRRIDRRTSASLAAIASQGRATATRVKTVERAVYEAGAMAALATTADPYPLPLGGNWALAWDAAVILAREVGFARPETVVELGSGGSSLVVGKQLRQAGHGHLYSLDHDPAFAQLTREHLRAHGLDDWVTVLDAPLVECLIGTERFRWYELPDAVRRLPRIDVLVVDGPPQATDRAGVPRYPAVPALRDKLQAGSLVFVDDAYRDAERTMVDRWLGEEPGWTVRVLKTVRGTALLRRSPDTAPAADPEGALHPAAASSAPIAAGTEPA